MGDGNCIMDRRVCIPISLSMVYLLIRQRLILPRYGIGMPGISW
jgi:regulator of sirC expression with transglutaminase-like and TPR domain